MLRVVLAVIFLIGTTFACTCEPPKDYEYYFCRHSIVIRAIVKPQPTKNATAPRATGVASYKLDIIDVYKNSTGEAVPPTVNTPDNSAACGYQFQTGKEYLIFGRYQEKDAFFTNLCSNNKQWDVVPTATVAKLGNAEYGSSCGNSTAG